MASGTTARVKVVDQVWLVAALLHREHADRDDFYAEIRQDRTVRAPDAFQLACAGVARVDLFITGDDRLSRCTVPGVQFIRSLERAFL